MPPPGVKARIERFWRAIRRLQEIRSKGLDQFLSNEDLIDAAERNLHAAVEAAIDVGEALVAQMKWRTPQSYRDVVRILVEQKVIDPQLGTSFEQAVVIRNILVHNYVYMTPREVFTQITRLESLLTRIMNTLLHYMQTHHLDP